MAVYQRPLSLGLSCLHPVVLDGRLGAVFGRSGTIPGLFGAIPGPLGGPKWAPRGLQEGPERPQLSGTLVRALCATSGVLPGILREPPWGFPEAPLGPQDGPRRLHECPKKAPSGPQDGPRKWHKIHACVCHFFDASWRPFGALLGAFRSPLRALHGPRVLSREALRGLQKGRNESVTHLLSAI